MSVNKVIVLGRLGQDPELKHTAGGAAVARLSVATDESWTDKQGQRQERTEWHRIVVWGKLAENCSRYLSKGRQVYLEGRLQTNSWEDDQGQKRYSTEIRAHVVQFLGSSRDGADIGPSRENTNPTPPPPPPPHPQGNGAETMLKQNYNVSTDSNFTADDIPF